MPDASEVLVDLLEHVKDDGRVCPMPPPWNRIWEMLPPEKIDDGGWNPPLPLILAAWRLSGDGEKRQRFAEHLKFAHDAGNLEAIGRTVRALPEDEWHHQGE